MTRRFAGETNTPGPPGPAARPAAGGTGGERRRSRQRRTAAPPPHKGCGRARAGPTGWHRWCGWSGRHRHRRRGPALKGGTGGGGPAKRRPGWQPGSPHLGATGTAGRVRAATGGIGGNRQASGRRMTPPSPRTTTPGPAAGGKAGAGGTGGDGRRGRATPNGGKHRGTRVVGGKGRHRAAPVVCGWSGRHRHRRAAAGALRAGTGGGGAATPGHRRHRAPPSGQTCDRGVRGGTGRHIGGHRHASAPIDTTHRRETTPRVRRAARPGRRWATGRPTAAAARQRQRRQPPRHPRCGRV